MRWVKDSICLCGILRLIDIIRISGLDLLLQFIHDLRMGRREFIFLVGIILQIVEFGRFFPIEVDELPVAIANGGAGDAALISPMGVVPKERGALKFGGGIFEQRNEAAAVDMLLC